MIGKIGFYLRNKGKLFVADSIQSMKLLLVEIRLMFLSYYIYIEDVRWYNENIKRKIKFL